MRRAVLVAVALACACKAKPDREAQCHDVVEHMRQVSAMPMREGDVMMFMGACTMWKQMMIDCMAATTNDADIAKCRERDK